MRNLMAICLLLCCTAGLRAQDRQASDSEARLIRDCAAQHVEDGEGESACAFKLVADPCIEKGGSNLGTANCYRMEEAIWDRLLNENYKSLMDSIEDRQDQDKLKDMQRAWIAYRDTTCDFYWHKIHGSMAVPMGAACRLRETARRSLLLKFMQGL